MLLAGLGAVAAGPVRAADECFCLRHAETDALLRGCTAFKAARDYYETAYCVDPETGTPSDQLIAFGWERVAAGEVGCLPCRPLPRCDTCERPRGEDGEEPLATTPEPEGAEGSQ